ncbi:MAG: hypothetical protein MJZ34_08685 [Paludibacteraceae bacterium]|nr:hypothetical protein [Paludibacteraceae bacterium]
MGNSGIDLFYELNLVGVGFSTDSVRYRRDYVLDYTYASEPSYVKKYLKYYSCGHLVDLDDIRYNAMVTISPKNFTSKTPLIESGGRWNPNAPKYDLWGREVFDSYEGIYIQSGKTFYNRK